MTGHNTCDRDDEKQNVRVFLHYGKFLKCFKSATSGGYHSLPSHRLYPPTDEFSSPPKSATNGDILYDNTKYLFTSETKNYGKIEDIDIVE